MNSREKGDVHLKILAIWLAMTDKSIDTGEIPVEDLLFCHVRCRPTGGR